MVKLVLFSCFIKLKIYTNFMNKKITKSLIAVSALTLGSFVQAQAQKNCELQVLSMESPSENMNIPFNTPVPVNFTIKNNGPDAIAATDTLFFMTSASQTDALLATGLTIASGASSPIDLGLSINHSSTTDQTTTFCVKIMKQSDIVYNVGGSPIPATVTYTDSDSTNNEKCVNVNLKKETVNILDVSNTVSVLNIYPNPATDVISFNLLLDKALEVNAKVIDVAGRVVLSENLGMVAPNQESKLQLNINNLSSGVYMIELTAGDYKAKGKVSVK
jgi:hypothetical protein